MKRRDFLAASCLAGVAPIGAVAAAEGPGSPSGREYYELRLYDLQADSKQAALEKFLAEAAIPALNRIGIEPVGVFKMLEGDDPNVYVLLPHKTPESFLTLTERLASDAAFMEAGLAFLEAPKSDPAYDRFESSLMLAFDHHPKLTVPSQKESRVFQLRMYESHNDERAKKKIEMFNEGGEIEIFLRTGLHPVFFGETLIGSRLPKLTYMVGFDDQEAMEAGWDKFRADPGWNELKQDPQYKETVSNITNLLLRPAGCSQI